MKPLSLSLSERAIVADFLLLAQQTCLDAAKMCDTSKRALAAERMRDYAAQAHKLRERVSA